MDQLQVNAAATEAQNDAEAEKFYDTLRSSGYDEARAGKLAELAFSLMKGISSILTRVELELTIGPDDDGMPLPLQHDERLLPYWKRFTDALSASNECTHIKRLKLFRIQLTKLVRDMLRQPLNKAPLDFLSFNDNGLGEDDYNWIINLLNTNTSLKTLYIKSNPLESFDNLSKAVADHPKLDAILLENCGIGHNVGVMKAVLNVFCLRVVSLTNNDIDSYGATLISDCLITNPTLQKLYLEENLLNDDDAKKFAFSLKSNTNLRMLDLSQNNLITREGMLYLAYSVYNINSLNAMGVSNHTCFIQFKDEEDVLDLRHVNEYVDPVINKNLKLFGLLQRYDMNYLKDDTPLQIIPKVLALLNIVAKNNELDAIFGFMKEWNLPLLYTNRRLVKDPRRSSGIGKNVIKYIKKCMGKK